ncbi:MAG: MMPL family transporter [Gaiellales bacterium]
MTVTPASPSRGALSALTGAIARHPWRAIGVWVLLIAAIIAGAQTLGGELQNNFSIPDSDAQRAGDLLEARFPARAGDSATIVFKAPDGLAAPAAKEAVGAAIAAAQGVPHIVAAGDPYAGESGQISQDGTVGYVDVQFDQQGWTLPAGTIDQLKDDVRGAVAGSGVDVAFTGNAVQEPPEQGASEALGLLAAVIVLLIVFGTVVAALLPIVLALLAVGLGIATLTLAAGFTDFNTITPILATMIGLGVGIDYSLFIVTRFRQALHEGATPAKAAGLAASTAGRAVIFAGTTVAISIVGLATIGLDFITKMGIGASLTVLTSVAVAVTLLPAVLSLLGRRVDRLKLPFVSVPDDTLAAQKNTAVARWGRFVTGRPWLFLLLPLAVMLLAAVPVLGIQLGAADAGSAPKTTTQRVAYDWLAEGFGPGFNGPLLIAVDTKGDSAAVERLQQAIASADGVAFATPPIPNEAGDTAIITAYATSAPQDKETAELVERLRADVIPEAVAGTGAVAYVGGATAAFEDISARIFSRIPWFLLFVVGITFLILTMAFRSVVVAIKAALTTILSCAASFGILTLVFQQGVGMGLIGLDRTGPIESFLPVIVFALVFGLSMDYEVFLVSRIREAFVGGDAPRLAITDGVAAIGRVIVAAAIIMSVVFFAFLTGVDRTIKEFGLALGLAIALDAFVVRLTLVPALMHLLDQRAWWIPRWFDRILPRLTIEAPEKRAD